MMMSTLTATGTPVAVVAPAGPAPALILALVLIIVAAGLIRRLVSLLSRLVGPAGAVMSLLAAVLGTGAIAIITVVALVVP